MPCKDCISGSLDVEKPKGKEITIATADGKHNIPCYLTTPTPADANGCAVILASDVFGYELPNARLIADAYADAGFVCVVPDLFGGRAVSIEVLEATEDLPRKPWPAAAATALWLLLQVPQLLVWTLRHPFNKAVELVAAVAQALRQGNGEELPPCGKVALQGYCYGGGVGLLMAARPGDVDAVCVAHPAVRWVLKLPRDIEAISAPVLFICADKDEWFPAPIRTRVKGILSEFRPAQTSGLLPTGSSSASRFRFYKGTRHGFAVRGDKRIEAVNVARKEALQLGISWFKQHLLGVQPSTEQEAAVAASSVGQWL